MCVTCLQSASASSSQWDKSDVGKVVEDRYMVSLNADTTELISDALSTIQLEVSAMDFEVEKVFSHLQSVPLSDGRRVPHVLARMTHAGFDKLQSHPLVRYIEQDRLVGLADNNSTCQQQGSPPWGLSRINQRGSFEEGSFFYNDTNQHGFNVDVYVLGAFN